MDNWRISHLLELKHRRDLSPVQHQLWMCTFISDLSDVPRGASSWPPAVTHNARMLCALLLESQSAENKRPLSGVHSNRNGDSKLIFASSFNSCPSRENDRTVLSQRDANSISFPVGKPTVMYLILKPVLYLLLSLIAVLFWMKEYSTNSLNPSKQTRPRSLDLWHRLVYLEDSPICNIEILLYSDGPLRFKSTKLTASEIIKKRISKNFLE